MTSPSDRSSPEGTPPHRAIGTAETPSSLGPIGRRNLLKAFGAGAVAVGAGGLLEACSGGIKGSSSNSGGGSGKTDRKSVV